MPQGSPVSSDIANLVLSWDGDEAILAEQLKNKGIQYSRYVDDIASSASRSLTNNEKTEVIKLVNSFIKSKGFQVSHKKTRVAGPRKTKCVTGVGIGEDKNNVTHEYVDSVYRQIKQFENEEALNNQIIASIKGKINYIRQLNPKQAARLEDFLLSFAMVS